MFVCNPIIVLQFMICQTLDQGGQRRLGLGRSLTLLQVGKELLHQELIILELTLISTFKKKWGKALASEDK